MYLDTYKMYIYELAYTHSMKGNDQHTEGMGTTTSTVLTISSSYKDPFGLA